MVRLITLIAMVALVSCSRKITTSSSVIDSTFTKLIPRTQLITAPGGKVIIERAIECDPVTNKPKPMKISGKEKRANAAGEIKENGILTITGGCDSLQEKITVMDKEIFHLRHESKKVEVPIYLTRRIDIFCRWFSAIAILIIGVGVFLKVKKIIAF